jgi:hypothetical protein
MSKIHVDGLVPDRQGTWQRETREISGRLTYVTTLSINADTDYTVTFPGTTEWVMWMSDTLSATAVAVGDSISLALPSATVQAETDDIYHSMCIEVQSLTFHDAGSGSGTLYVIAALKEAKE